MDGQNKEAEAPALTRGIKVPGRRKGKEYECMCFRAKEPNHLKYLVRLANRFVCLGTTEYCEEKAKDERPGERPEE